MERKINREDVFVFLFTFSLMIITHGFSFANLMYSHDSLDFFNMNPSWKIGIGRWLYPLMLLLRNFATPWMMGICCSVCVSISVVLIARLFRFDRLKSVCVAILFSTNITLIALFSTYSFDADADGIALLLSCFAVYAFDRFPGKKIIPIVSIVGCMALYQAYVSVAIGLFLFVLIYRAEKCKNDKELRNVFMTGVEELGILFAAAVIYAVLMVVIGNILGSGLINFYNGPKKVIETSITSYLLSIPKAYASFIKRMIWLDARNNVMVLIATFLLFIITCIDLRLYIINHKKYLGSLKMIIPCLLLLPLGFNAMYVVSAGLVHQLMMFAFCMIFFLPLILTDIAFESSEINDKANELKKKLYVTAFASIMVIGISNMILANGFYTYKKLVYDNTILHAHQVWVDVNSIDGYVEGETPVVFIGAFMYSKASYDNSIADRFKGVMLSADSSSITYEDTLINFYEGILGRNMRIEIYDKTELNNYDVSSMPEYPSKGYSIMNGDRVFVKLSELDNMDSD